MRWMHKIMIAAVVLGLAACAKKAPEHASTSTASDSAASAVEYWTCSMHPSIKETQPGRCPLCGMDLTPVKRGGTHPDSVDLTFHVSTEQQQMIGVNFAAVERRSIQSAVQAFGRVDIDETRQAVVNLRVSGWIEKVYVDFLGQAVKRGAPLFLIYSPDLVSAQSEYLLAKRTQDERLMRTARERLLMWQFTEAQIAELETRGEAATRVDIHAPASGIVVEKMAVPGMRVEPGMTLYRIADLSTVWVQADVYESELALVEKGQLVTVSFPALGGARYFGSVAFIDPVLNPTTRAARVRIVLDNPDGLFKPEMYAQVNLAAPLGERLVVPASAVLRTGQRELVFVDKGSGVLELRLVHTGVRGDGYEEITHGLVEGERVATSANFLLDAESRVQGVLQRLEGDVPSGTPAHQH